MASSSNVANPLLGIQNTEKLTKTNHVLWKAQVLTTIRGARLEGHLTGKIVAPAAENDEKLQDGNITKVPNPAFEEWFARTNRFLGSSSRRSARKSSLRSRLHQPPLEHGKK